MSSTGEEAGDRERVEAWADAVGHHDLEGVVAHHAEDVVFFDVPPPAQVLGLQGYREAWPPFFAYLGGSGPFELQELRVVVGTDVAFAHAIVLVQGDGDATPGSVRLTVGLRKTDGEWTIATTSTTRPLPGEHARAHEPVPRGPPDPPDPDQQVLERNVMMTVAKIQPRPRRSRPREREIRIERIFNAPRERVWRAITDPELVAQWWGRGNKLVVERMEVERGGHWRFVEHGARRRARLRGALSRGDAARARRADLRVGRHAGLRRRRDRDPRRPRRRPHEASSTSSLFHTTEERDGMLKSGMEGGLNESYAALDRLLAGPRCALAGAAAGGEDGPDGPRGGGAPGVRAVVRGGQRQGPRRRHEPDRGRLRLVRARRATPARRHRRHPRGVPAQLRGHEEPLQVDLPDLKVIVRDDIAVTWGLNHMQAQEPGKERFASWSRGTRVMQRIDGEWKMIHQHLSYPYDPRTGQAQPIWSRRSPPG